MPNWFKSALSPSQSLEVTNVTSCLLLKEVGSALYYVTSAEVGVAEATGNLWIQKSTDGGASFVQTYNDLPTTGDYIAVVVVGTIIYIFSSSNVYRYDTATDSLLSDGAAAPARVMAAQPLADGKIFAVLGSHSGGGLSCAVYDPLLDSWTGASDLTDSDFCVGLAIDPGTQIACVFSGTSDGSTITITCYPVREDLTIGAAAAATTLPGGSSSLWPTYATGTPCVFGGAVILPYVNPGDGGQPSDVLVVRATVGTSLTFGAPETVVTGQTQWTLDAPNWFGTAAIDASGTLAVLFSTNVNALDNSSSQASVSYAISPSAGTWSTPQVIYTASVPSSSGSLYPLLLSDASVGIIEVWFNPVEFNGSGTKYASLSVVYLNGPLALSIACGTCTVAATEGVPYTCTLHAAGGTPPYTYSIASGSLPAGVTLNPATGVISGTPTVSGTFNFTVKVAGSV